MLGLRLTRRAIALTAFGSAGRVALDPMRRILPLCKKTGLLMAQRDRCFAGQRQRTAFARLYYWPLIGLRGGCRILADYDFHKTMISSRR